MFSKLLQKMLVKHAGGCDRTGRPWSLPHQLGEAQGSACRALLHLGTFREVIKRAHVFPPGAKSSKWRLLNSLHACLLHMVCKSHCNEWDFAHREVKSLLKARPGYLVKSVCDFTFSFPFEPILL